MCVCERPISRETNPGTVERMLEREDKGFNSSFSTILFFSLQFYYVTMAKALGLLRPQASLLWHDVYQEKV